MTAPRIATQAPLPLGAQWMPLVQDAAEPSAAGWEAERDVRSGTLEGVAQIDMMLIIGGAAGAGSFRHVQDVAAAHGQAGWLAWSDAVVLELMSIAAGLELRRRKRAHAPVAFPAAVMATAVVVSLGAQVVDAERSPIGWIAAAIPALGFLAMVKMAIAQPGSSAPPGLDSRPPVSSDDLQSAEDGDSEPGTGTGTGTGAWPSRTLDPVVERLMPAARAAVTELDREGRRLSRHALAESLRADGHAVSNARTSALLAVLKGERGDSPPLRVLDRRV